MCTNGLLLQPYNQLNTYLIHIFLCLYSYCQVTNQMITACKAYITNNGANSIWDQPQEVVVDKIKAAINLNQVLDHVYWQNVKPKV